MGKHLLKYLFSAGLLLTVSRTAWSAGSPADSLWRVINELPSDTAKVSAVIRGAVWLNSQFKDGKEVEELLRKGLHLADSIRDLQGIAQCENLLGVHYRENSQYEEAIHLHEKALTLAREITDSVLMAYSLNNLGVAYRRLDENEKAFNYHFEALKIAQNIGNVRNQAIAINSIGNIQLTLGNYNEAIEEFKKSLQIEIQAKNPLGMAINYANMGACWEGLDQLDKAVPLYKKSLFYNREADSYTGMAICYNLLGNVYMKQGDYDRALGYLQRALSIHNKVKDKINVAENYITIGKILLKQRKADHALKSMQHGLDLAIAINSRYMMVQAWQAIAEAQSQKGQAKQAYQAMQNAFRIRDSLYVQQAGPQMAKMRTLYELNKKDNQIKLLQQANQIKELKLTRQRLLALSAVIILLLVIVALFLYNRQRRIKAHRRILLYELQSLRSQMNPHFIFNSLNSIHKYIWSNEQEEASEYLAKFSRLMRLILENTRFRTVVLTNEIEFLHLYVGLEVVRCNDRFVPSIEVAEDLNPSEILVPSMIIQPFVENAIWHGLAHRDQAGGKLHIRFYKKEALLICEVEDNGIGRKRAKAIKAGKASAHQSIGIQVTEARLQLLKMITKNKNTQVHVIDLENNNREPMGTKVILHLPLEYAF